LNVFCLPFLSPSGGSWPRKWRRGLDGSNDPKNPQAAFLAACFLLLCTPATVGRFLVARMPFTH
jgi:hypothetical protein